jgi:energy-coupling factor transporter transmembrane protein EcfT
MGICEFSLKKLNEKLKNPWFQTSVIVLMVAVVYPFLRLAIYIMSIIWLLIFEIFKKAKVYTIQKVTAEIEKIW